MPQTTDTDVDQIVQRYIAAWSEPQAAARKRAVAELWAPDGVEFVEGAQFRGHDGLVDRISEAYGLSSPPGSTTSPATTTSPCTTSSCSPSS
ncbi:nuclear transport factor 2 family protein [Streptomyces sp. NPDC020800]|uniref:nuclear transport factor 2 family protein n=1 Tax=Streptomyces sp. NPDC020800 TaxID=3365092 RepID=UPI003793508D